VTPLVLQLQALQRSIVSTNDRLTEANRKVSGGNGYPIEALKRKIKELTTHQLQLVESFHSVLNQLQGLGAWIKDLQMGLVDFYGMRDQQYVWWCWKLGEKRIAYWHALGDGYAGRQPL